MVDFLTKKKSAKIFQIIQNQIIRIKGRKGEGGGRWSFFFKIYPVRILIIFDVFP